MDSLRRTSGACVVLKEDAFSFLYYFFSIFSNKIASSCSNLQQPPPTMFYPKKMKFSPNERQSMNLRLCLQLVPKQIKAKGIKKLKIKDLSFFPHNN
jgi:hypothetical protein